MRADVRAVAFDVNGTLTEIVTDEGMDEIFRAVGHFLTYQGIDLRRHEVRDLYLGILKRQQQGSAEEHAEFDAVAIWRTIISEYQTGYPRRSWPSCRGSSPSSTLASPGHVFGSIRTCAGCSTCCAPAFRWPWSP